jgi:acyl-CoA reductase-like NAD-dependent aldehyde dehydrogenase
MHVNQDAAARVRLAREAQPAWADTPLPERLRLLRRFRHDLPARTAALVTIIERVHPRPPGETLAAEVLPLAEACRFLERRAPRILRPRRLPAGLRLLWMGGTQIELRRDSFGVVLVIGPANYPLLLPGVQALQALAAGNAVVLKPGRHSRPAAVAFASALEAAGLEPDLCPVLDEATDAARDAIDAGVDKVVLTGSADTGRAVLAQLAPHLTPATVELSGCDAVFVRHDADLDLVTDALRFGLRLNDGRTCIAPRRVFVHTSLAAKLEFRLRRVAEELGTFAVDPAVAASARRLAREAVEQGARRVWGALEDDAPFAPVILADASPEMELLREDVFAPVLSMVSVESDEAALAAAARCPYALGATVFGSRRAARALARRVPAGAVVVNDMVAPTAEPRMPFGGRGRSGFGVTRGAEGLLEMTRLKAIAVPRGWWRPHLLPAHPSNARMLEAGIAALHAGTLRARLRGWLGLLRALRERRKEES